MSGKKGHLKFSVLTLLVLLSAAHFPLAGSEIISLTTGAASAALFGAGLGAYKYLKCKFYECCDVPWIRQRTTPLLSKCVLSLNSSIQSIYLSSSVLQSEVNERLYGQHIAQEIVLKAIRAHMAKP